MSTSSDKPFIYMATLRRSGSKMLSQLLSLPPYAYVFRETGLPRGRFRAGRNEARLFEAMGVDFARINKRLDRWFPRNKLAYIEREVLPELLKHVRQVGVKEIRNRKWEQLAETFDNVRAIVTARDPRDIYLSLVHKAEDRGVGWKGPLTPEGVAEHIQEEFGYQRDIAEQLPSMKVRYEDLCMEPGMLSGIKSFVESDVPEQGLLSPDLARLVGDRCSDEVLVALRAVGEAPDSRAHQGTVSTRAVARWKREKNAEHKEQAQRVYDLLPEYVSYWEYPREGVSVPQQVGVEG